MQAALFCVPPLRVWAWRKYWQTCVFSSACGPPFPAAPKRRERRSYCTKTCPFICAQCGIWRAPRWSVFYIDSRESHAALQEFCSEYVPEVSGRLEHYAGERPLFDMHGVEDEIQRALGRKVDLKSGGYLIIDQTEAMTTIDVNTGSFVGQA